MWVPSLGHASSLVARRIVELEEQPVQEPAYTALLQSGYCPSGGVAFRVAQGMPHTRLAPPTPSSSLGRSVWAVAGTSGSSSERLSFRLLVDRANYRLDGYTES